MNDISLSIDSSIEQFADDAKLYRVVKCSEEVVKLQKDLDCIAMEWSLHSLLSLSIDKCKAICISLHNNFSRLLFYC